MKKMKYNLYEMLGKLDPQYEKFLNEQKEQYKGAVPYEELPEEDRALFSQLFDTDRMRSSVMSGGIKGNYIDTKEIRSWDEPEGEKYKQQLNQKVEKFNNNSQQYNMTIVDYSDWEREPGERDWNAHYEFIFIPK